MIKAEKDEIKSTKTTEKIKETKGWFFEINKNDKILFRLIKKK